MVNEKRGVMNKNILMFVLVVGLIVGCGGSVFAIIDLSSGYWNTTYDCDAWTQSDGLLVSDVDCDGIGTWGAWTCSGGEETEITSAANYSGGDGGRGARFYVGDGINDNSGGLRIVFNSLQSDVWVRWYMRYEAGFQWNPLQYDKWLYFDVGTLHYVVPEWYSSDEVNIYAGGGSGNVLSGSGNGWNTLMGGTISDGQWHCYEIHIKMDTNGLDGIAEMWIDGVQRLSNGGVDFGTASGWDCFHFFSNQATPNNGKCMAVDYDDMAISNTGYIGPLAVGPDTIPPTILITSPTDGQTISGITTISSTASDNVGVAGVQFKLDGANFGAEDTASPYSISWDTTTVSDGSYSLTATARDAAGNNATSSSVGVVVNNTGSSGTIFFQEFFEDTNFALRGWYDNTGLQLSTTEYIAGSTSSVEYHFLQGASTPTSGGAIRKKFTDTDEVYVSYWVKYSSNWEGSNLNYHPHEFLILSNLDGDWDGPAYNYLTTYIEQNEGEPLFAIQDGKNVDESNISVDLTGITENRSVAGCNGDSDGYGDGTCYLVGTIHANGKDWRAGSVYFQDTPGQYYKNDWHFVEAYLKLNSISGGIGQNDGIMKYWYDGNLIMDYSDVVMRTGQYSNMMFNQFMIAPWIGDGSPVDQTFWVDDLTVADYRVGGTLQTCTDAGGTCQTNTCDTYTDCTSLSGTCVSGYCCSGTCTVSSTCGLADTNIDGVVNMTEIIDYMAGWKAGNVTVVDLVAGIDEWKMGC